MPNTFPTHNEIKEMPQKILKIKVIRTPYNGKSGVQVCRK
jgi:hypothetical protein